MVLLYDIRRGVVGRSVGANRKRYGKIFACANRGLTKSTEVAEVEHDLRPPARDMHVTPGITSASLTSTGKYANPNYASLFLKDRVEVFDLENAKKIVSKRQSFTATDTEMACREYLCGPRTQRPWTCSQV